MIEFHSIKMRRRIKTKKTRRKKNKEKFIDFKQKKHELVWVGFFATELMIWVLCYKYSLTGYSTI